MEGLFRDYKKVSVRSVDDKGFGLFATAAVEEGDIMLKDRPIAFFSEEYDFEPDEDQLPEIVCACCGRHVGTLQLQFKVAAGLLSADGIEKDFAMNPKLSVISDQTIELSQIRSVPDPVYQKKRYYCSEQCEQDVVETTLNCTSENEDASQALKAFYEYCWAIDDESIDGSFFIMAAKLLARDSAWSPSVEHLVKVDYISLVVKNGGSKLAVLTYLKATLEYAKRFIKEKHSKYLHLDGWAHLVGAVALNAIAIKIPNPCSRYCIEVDDTDDEKRKTEYIRTLAPLILRAIAKATGGADQIDFDENDEKDGVDEGDACRHHNANPDANGDGDGDGDGDGEYVAGGDDDETVTFDWRKWDNTEQKQAPSLVFHSGLFQVAEGEAVYPRLSKLNHSCDPNCTVAYIGSNECIIFANRPITPNEELTISYVPRGWSVLQRKEHLKQRYGFDCACTRCIHQMTYPDQQSNAKQRTAARNNTTQSNATCCLLQNKSTNATISFTS